MENNKVLDVTQLSEYLFLSRSRIADLKSSGVLIPLEGVTARGRGGGHLYDADVSRERYIKFLRKAAAVERGKASAGIQKSSGSTDLPGYGFDEKLKAEQWREKKRKNDLAENEIVEVAQVQVALMNVSSKLATVLQKIVPDVHRFWPDANEELIEVIQDAVNKAMVAASEIQLSEEDLYSEGE